MELDNRKQIKILNEIEAEFTEEELIRLDSDIAKATLPPVIRHYLQTMINVSLEGIINLMYKPEDAVKYAYAIAEYRGTILVAQELLAKFKSSNQ
jgi:hypothetical protein